jgi:thiosulfate dehydrogenase [quinone] large subunit
MTTPTPCHLDEISNVDAALGYGLLRLTMGLNFLVHSFGRWRNMVNFVEGIVAAFAHTPLPVWSVRAFALVIPLWEPVVGVLLVLGLWTRWALVAGALLIAALVFGTSLRGDYTVLSEQLIYALIFFVLLLFRARHDCFGLDGLRSMALCPAASINFAGPCLGRSRWLGGIKAMNFGLVPINWYGINFAIAIFTARSLVRRWAPKYGFSQDSIDRLLLWIMISVVVAGTRTYPIVQNDFLFYLTHPWNTLAIWEGGLVFFGGLIWLWTANNVAPFSRFDMLKDRMRLGIHIAATLLAVVTLITPLDCLSSGERTREAAACCLKGECHPGANADDCCKNTVPDGSLLLAPIAKNHHVPLVVSTVADSGTLVSTQVSQRLTNELTHPPPPRFLATVDLPLLI